MIELRSISGYEEVGRNMSALRIDDSVFILDMGIELESYVKYVGDDDISKITAQELIDARAIPDDSVLRDWKGMVKAILLTHAHLDHIGAVPFLAKHYPNVPIIGTPFTIEILKRLSSDNGLKITNPMRIVHPNSRVKFGDIEVEFVHVTHSTPQTTMIVLHTKKGAVVYANDYKLDKYPILGKKTNIERLREIGKEGVLALIVDSTRAMEARKTPSESIARDMLRDVLLGVNHKNKIIIITTFSSHLARLKSILHFADLLNRKVVFLGRSLAKYVLAGDKVGITNFSSKVQIIGFSDKIKKFLKNIEDSRRGDYLLVVTGHQGEPNSVLSRIANNKLKFKIYREDPIIFSCNVIPTETNIHNRKVLEDELLKKRVRLFKDIHVSGHACKEDHRELINMLMPEHVIPAHGNKDMKLALKELCLEMGYSEKQVHLLKNKSKLVLVK